MSMSNDDYLHYELSEAAKFFRKFHLIQIKKIKIIIKFY